MSPAVRASGRASARVATAAAAPVRSAVTDPPSMIASSSPVTASLTRIVPITVGNRLAGLPGKEVTHLSSAVPSPRAGIALKSPCGGLSR